MSEKPASQRSATLAICPWCGHEHGDCWEWVKDRPEQTRCDSCDNMFTVEADYSVSYRSYVSGNEKP
jgi:hypothetical protein